MPCCFISYAFDFLYFNQYKHPLLFCFRLPLRIALFNYSCPWSWKEPATLNRSPVNGSRHLDMKWNETHCPTTADTSRGNPSIIPSRVSQLKQKKETKKCKQKFTKQREKKSQKHHKYHLPFTFVPSLPPDCTLLVLLEVLISGLPISLSLDSFTPYFYIYIYIYIYKIGKSGVIWGKESLRDHFNYSKFVLQI